MAMTTSALSPSLPFLSVPPPASKKNPGALQRRPLSSCRRPPPPRGALRRGNAPPLRFSRSSDDDRSGSLSRQALPKDVDLDAEKSPLKRFLAPIVGASLFMVNPSAHALTPGLPFDLPENWVEILVVTGSFIIIYLFVVPLGLYYYLEKRWFKRKMAEAILQFGLVFLFFPGMLLLAPFINFRPLPRKGAKEPWDEIRPL